MANLTVKQVYDLTAVTVLADTDLFYLSQSPYGVGDDAGMDGAAWKENVRDTVAAFAVAGTDMSIVHDDGANTLTFNFIGTIPTVEDIQDDIGSIFNSTLVYDDVTPAMGRAAITGDVAIAAGSNDAVIQADSVENSMLSNMAQSTIKLRAAGTGTGDPIDGTPAQGRTVLELGTAATQNTGTSGATLPFLNGNNTWSGNVTFNVPSSAAFNASGSTELMGYNWVSTFAGATAGPYFTVFRDSASPAASDLIGNFNFQGRNSGGTSVAYLLVQGAIVDPTAGSEDSEYQFWTQTAGALASRMAVRSGLTMAGATGGDQGAGEINATEVNDDGTPLVCMPLNDDFDQADWNAQVTDKIIPATYQAVFEEKPVLDADGKPTGKTIPQIVDMVETSPARTEKRIHRTAKRHFDMAAEGFDPKDPKKFVDRLRADKAVPGLLTVAEWQSRMFPADPNQPIDKVSVAERTERTMLALDYTAVALAAAMDKIEALETANTDLGARLAVLEAKNP